MEKKKYTYNLKVQQKKHVQVSYMHKTKEDSKLVEKEIHTTKLTAGDGSAELTIQELVPNRLPQGESVKVIIESVQTTLDEHEDEVAQ